VDIFQVCTGMPSSLTSTRTGSDAVAAWTSLVHLLKKREKPGPWRGKPRLNIASVIAQSGKDRRKSSGVVALIIMEETSTLNTHATSSNTCWGATTRRLPLMVTSRARQRAASAWSMELKRPMTQRGQAPSSEIEEGAPAAPPFQARVPSEPEGGGESARLELIRHQWRHRRRRRRGGHPPLILPRRGSSRHRIS
jgi:hypothetical protein